MDGLVPVQVPAGIHIDSLYITFDGQAAIGMVMKGMNNRREPAFIRPGVQEALRELLVQAPSDANTLHCTIQFTALRASEQSAATSESATCALNFDVLARTDSGPVLLYEHAHTLSVRGGLDATGKHGRAIRNNLELGLQGFAQARAEGRLTPRRITTSSERPAPSLEDLGYNVLMRGDAPRGIYHSFMDMRDQRPDTTIAFEVKPLLERNDRSTQVKLKWPDGEPPHEVWGFSDGRDIHMNVGGRYARLFRDHQQFTARIPTTEASSGALAFGVGYMFGAVGVGVMVVVAGGSVPSGFGTADRVSTYKLDLMTGSFIPAHADPHEPTRCQQVFIYSKHSALDTIVDLKIEGAPAVSMHSNSYHVAAPVARPIPGKAQVSVGAGAALAIPLDLTEVDVAQVYLIKVKKDGTPTLDRVGSNMATDLLQKLDGMERAQ